MKTNLVKADELLKGAIMRLPDSGQKGFKGLVRVVFEEITNSPFGLEKSGNQFGNDGQSASSNIATAFECKRILGSGLALCK